MGNSEFLLALGESEKSPGGKTSDGGPVFRFVCRAWQLHVEVQ